MRTFNIIIALFLIALTSCQSESSERLSDLYNPTAKLQQIDEEITFWQNKIVKDGNNTSFASKLASAYMAHFDATADISSLKKAESIYQVNLEDSPTNCNALRALAQNYVSQHRFSEAKDLILQAEAIGEDLRFSHLLLYDVYEELAQNQEAETVLDKLSEKKDFNYLIRAAKNQDKHGDLDAAIALLEEAKTKAELSKNTSRLKWIYSNMGDFYGHAGRLEDSKTSFCKALALDPSDWYSLKGLAYMAWSADGDAKSALRMINKAKAYTADPSLALLEADITEFNGNPDDANIMRSEVFKTVSAPAYGNMYNSFRVHYNLNMNALQNAEQIAQEELKVRTTPSAYALMAVTKQKQNKTVEALEIASKQVIGKTYEPKILLEVLPVVATVDSLKTAILFEVDEASYELGPLAYKELKTY